MSLNIIKNEEFKAIFYRMMRVLRCGVQQPTPLVRCFPNLLRTVAEPQLEKTLPQPIVEIIISICECLNI